MQQNDLQEDSVFMNYTEQMENALWQKWNELDEEFDNTTTLDFLNDEDEFRTFGDGLITLISKKYPDTDLTDVPKFLAAMCKENNMDINAIASRNTLKNWFEGDKRPKKGEADREHMFALSFALNFTTEETAELFHKVYLDRAFDFRNEKELVYYFCISNNKPWSDAQSIISSIEHLEGSDDKTIYTSVIKKDVDTFTDEAQLLTYIKNHRHNLEQSNKTAKEHLARLLAETKELVRIEATLPEHEGQYDGMWKKEDTVSTNFMYSVIMDTTPSSSKGTTTVFKNARLPKEIKNRFPEATSFAEKEPTYESIRKMIILLFSYVFWYQVQWQNVQVDIDDYTEQLNALLNECGMSLLYYGNPFDWLFLYCTVSERPLDAFRDMIDLILDNE